MAETSYLFYDLETTGLNKCFDQVLQFAAIRTDTQLKELDRHEIKIKLNPEVIPSPEAVITHRIGIQEMQHGELEVDAIRKIHALMNIPGTISVGYNTLSFDDEFLRFSFYRNLLPPYTHQFANRCRRMDIYPITTLFYLFNPDVLNWPQLDGRISLKLDALSTLNKLAIGQAHNAMVDVEATLALARKLAQSESMWHYACGYFEKNKDLERLSQLPYSLKIAENELQEGLMINGSFGSKNAFQAPVVGLGQHLHYRNQTLWLRLDNEDLSKTEVEALFVVRKRAAEQPLVLPPKKRFLTQLSIKRKEMADANRRWLQANPKFMQQALQYHRDYKYPINPNTDSQAALYELGFPPPYEEKLYRDFHAADAKNKAKFIERFADNTRTELAWRLMARFYPTFIADDKLNYYQSYCQQINSEYPPQDFRGEKQLSIANALQRIEDLKTGQLDDQQHKLLDELKTYLQRNSVMA